MILVGPLDKVDSKHSNLSIALGLHVLSPLSARPARMVVGMQEDVTDTSLGLVGSVAINCTLTRLPTPNSANQVAHDHIFGQVSATFTTITARNVASYFFIYALDGHCLFPFRSGRHYQLRAPGTILNIRAGMPLELDILVAQRICQKSAN